MHIRLIRYAWTSGLCLAALSAPSPAQLSSPAGSMNLPASQTVISADVMRARAQSITAQARSTRNYAGGSLRSAETAGSDAAAAMTPFSGGDPAATAGEAIDLSPAMPLSAD